MFKRSFDAGHVGEPLASGVGMPVIQWTGAKAPPYVNLDSVRNLGPAVNTTVV